MEFVFCKRDEHEGNDCWIDKSAYVVEIESYYVATCVAKISGWWGPEEKCLSKGFNDEQEAVKFCERFLSGDMTI